MRIHDAVETKLAPAAIGPYSQAVVAAGKRTLFVSGQIPLDPATGALVTGDIAAQTRRAMENLVAVLRAAGSDVHDVCKTTIFLADMGDFATVNEVYASFFEQVSAFPARATVEVSRLPRDVGVEIDCVAIF